MRTCTNTKYHERICYIYYSNATIIHAVEVSAPVYHTFSATEYYLVLIYSFAYLATRRVGLSKAIGCACASVQVDQSILLLKDLHKHSNSSGRRLRCDPRTQRLRTHSDYSGHTRPLWPACSSTIPILCVLSSTHVCLHYDKRLAFIHDNLLVLGLHNPRARQVFPTGGSTTI